jgi:hypothetical protein
MAAFLFVTAAVAVVMGLVALIAGHMPRSTGHHLGARGLLASRRAGGELPRANSHRCGHVHGKEVNLGTMIEPQTGLSGDSGLR